MPAKCLSTLQFLNIFYCFFYPVSPSKQCCFMQNLKVRRSPMASLRVALVFNFTTNIRVERKGGCGVDFLTGNRRAFKITGSSKDFGSDCR